MSEIKLYDRICIGDIDAIVCNIYDNQNLAVVYLNNGKAIYEDVAKKDSLWEFKISGSCGSYADNIPRLSNYVDYLRNKRWRRKID